MTSHAALLLNLQPSCVCVRLCGSSTQERASKQLPGPGQHFSFGALKPWEDVLAMLDDKPGKHERVQPGKLPNI